MFSSPFWWAMVGIGLMLLEFAAPGLVLFFFGLGALFVAAVSYFVPLSLSAEILIFGVASIIALVVLRRCLKSVFLGNAHSQDSSEASEGLMGREGVVLKAIAPGSAGSVELSGTAWSAESADVLEPGDPVVVVGQKSIKLIVKRSVLCR